MNLTNFIGLAIQAKISVSALFAAQIGTHPRLTSPPPAYPVIKAGRNRSCVVGGNRQVIDGRARRRTAAARVLVSAAKDAPP